MILVTGATGQVGTALVPRLQELGRVVTPGRDVLDLARPGAIRMTLDDLQPSVVVNLGAWTAVDEAEDRPRAALAVNGHSVVEMAAWAAANDAWLLTVSTDYVFDGTGEKPLPELPATSPVNAYGHSKLVGERAVLDRGAGVVARTSWVVSATHDNFVTTMLRLLADGVDPRVVDDQHGRLTIADDLAGALHALVALRPGGVVHVANPPATTWFTVARTVARMAGFDPARVTACSSDAHPTRARRPAWSVLATQRLDELGIGQLPSWRPGLQRVVTAQCARLGLD